MSSSVFCVSPAQLHEYWGLVQPELVRLHKRFPAEWIPEDIYADIRGGASYLYVVSQDATPCGFYVLQPRGRELLLHIIAMLKSAPKDKHYTTILAGLHELRQTAIAGKFQRVVAYSVRPGATRYFHKFGFTPTEVKFEMKI